MWDFSVIGIEFFNVFYCFFIYCFLGWIWECSYCSTVEGKLINRGFLNGPVIPIYGCASTGMLLLFFNPKMAEIAAESSVRSYLIIFFLGALVASAFEYFTSWIMEVLFHAKWWDYSHVPLNLNGRICLPVSGFWGLMAIVLVKFLHPLTIRLIALFPRTVAEYVGDAIFVIFLADLVSTVIATVELDKKITVIAKIKDEFSDWISGIWDVEAASKTEFKEKYGETKVGDVLEHAMDRIDATIAFTMQGYDQHKDEMDEKIDGRIESINKVLAANRIRMDKVAGIGKNKVEQLTDVLHGAITKVASGFKGYYRYTANRLRRAFPTMRFTGIRENAMTEIDEQFGYNKKPGWLRRILYKRKDK